MANGEKTELYVDGKPPEDIEDERWLREMFKDESRQEAALRFINENSRDALNDFILLTATARDRSDLQWEEEAYRFVGLKPEPEGQRVARIRRGAPPLTAKDHSRIKGGEPEGESKNVARLRQELDAAIFEDRMANPGRRVQAPGENEQK